MSRQTVRSPRRWARRDSSPADPDGDGEIASGPRPVVSAAGSARAAGSASATIPPRACDACGAALARTCGAGGAASGTGSSTGGCRGGCTGGCPRPRTPRAACGVAGVNPGTFLAGFAGHHLRADSAPRTTPLVSSTLRATLHRRRAIRAREVGRCRKRDQTRARATAPSPAGGPAVRISDARRSSVFSPPAGRDSQRSTGATFVARSRAWFELIVFPVPPRPSSISAPSAERGATAPTRSGARSP